MDVRLTTSQTLENFRGQRFRPDMKRDSESWLKLDPLNNPAPLHMPAHRQKEAAKFTRLQPLSNNALQASRPARLDSDQLVLPTAPLTHAPCGSPWRSLQSGCFWRRWRACSPCRFATSESGSVNLWLPPATLISTEGFRCTRFSSRFSPTHNDNRRVPEHRSWANRILPDLC